MRLYLKKPLGEIRLFTTKTDHAEARVSSWFKRVKFSRKSLRISSLYAGLHLL